MRNLVSAIYYHPEAYPPTLNALNELSAFFDEVAVVHRPHLHGSWKYPVNVKTVPSGRFVSSRDQERSSKVTKAFYFSQFTYDFYRQCLKLRPAVILIYDAHAFFAYYLIRPLLPKHILWYHNHDISEKARESKYSIGWFACDAEKDLFSQIDLFTLPSEERLKYFPIDRLKGKCIVLPNYPLKSFYKQFRISDFSESFFDLVFQGRIAEGHGLEELIDMVGQKVDCKVIRLVLKGHCDPDYKKRLLDLAGENRMSLVSFIGFTPYSEVPKAAAGCNVGVGIFTKADVMNLTLGTASNKIYEYAALGLPVIYLKGSAVSGVLAKYKWAIATELSRESLIATFSYISINQDILRSAAISDFESSLNFETVFNPVIDYLKPKISSI
jgi:hypothetical protein